MAKEKEGEEIRAGAQGRRFLSADPAVQQRLPARLAGARDLLRGKRQPQGQAGGVPARRTRRRHGCQDAPLLQSEALPHRAVRSARLRQQPADRQPGRQHHLASGVRHRGAARAPEDRTLAGVRRLVGLDAGAGLFAEAPAALHRAGVARHLPAAALGARVVLPGPGRRGRDVPRPVGALHRAAVGGGARGLHAVLLQAPHQRRPQDAARGGARLVDLGGRARPT